MSAAASGNSRPKKAATAAGVLRLAKLARPGARRNSVAVKLPSVLGSAISMKPPRGQMCSAFALEGVCCRRAAGSVSSL